MRSLEKVAYDKGLVKPEPLSPKKASVTKTADIAPTDDLMENIVKLCTGLRSEGLEKQAVEVETNFLNYKRAQTLYEAFKEKGEDLVERAHPHGSHKLENVDGEEATVEDILDKHKKILQVVEKKPTGKLASSNDILDAVKVALGVDPLAVRKDKSSDPRSYLSTKKSLGQETVAAPAASGISGIGGALTGVGAILTIQQAIRVLTNWRVGYNMARAEKAIEFLIRAAPKNPTALRWVMNTLPRLPVARAVPAAAEAVTTVTNMVPAAAAVAETAAPAAVAAEAGGVTSWLSGIGSSTWAALTSPIGSISGEGVSMVGGAGGAAAAGGAIAAGGIIGLIVGNHFFKDDFESTNLIETGNRLLSDIKSESEDLSLMDRKYVNDFFQEFIQVKNVLARKDQIANDPTQENLIELSRLDSLLRTSAQSAQDIWSMADDHAQKEFLGNVRAFGTIKARATNYIKLAGNLRDEVLSFFKQLRNLLESKGVQKPANGGIDQLISGYQKSLNTIAQYESIVKNKNLPHAAQLNGWLQNMKTYINDESQEFSSIDAADKLTAAKEYFGRLNEINKRLAAAGKVIT